VLLAIGGGIAAYKSAILCSRLAQSGRDVRVAMTSAATHFVGPATLSALSSHPVAIDTFDPRYPLGAHIELADECDLMIVAPATANLMSKFAHGGGDDLISLLYLQVECRVLVVPAMSASMWSKPSVVRNVEQLRRDGCYFCGPESGWLSCRRSGEGRMSEPDAIVDAVDKLLADVDPPSS
jgi:phosphopantothenoylcysteine decarboxylase